MATDEDTPQIHVDSDWKSQAQAEKERLREMAEKAESEAASTGGGTAGIPGMEGAGASSTAGTGGGGIPQANWDALLGSLATQAMLYLGGIADPRTGRPIVDLEAARHYVDLLTVLQEKTQGNLSDEESKGLGTVLYELRMRYVQIAQAAGAAMSEASGSENDPNSGDVITPGP